MMTQKERLESALRSALSENQSAFHQFNAACRRRDKEAIEYWRSAWTYWSQRIDQYEKQLKEVNG